MGLKRKALSAVRWTSLDMLGKTALQFLQIVVLVRFLDPDDFGLMAITVAIIAFAQIFADVGISNAIVHKQDIGQEQLSSLYWLNVSASSVLMLILMLASPVFAALYDERRIIPILIWVSVSFPLAALGRQLLVVAQKDLRFAELTLVEVLAALIGLVVAVFIAKAGGGVYALVAALLARVLATTVLAWSILAGNWRPLWRLRLSEIREFLHFGGYMLGFNLVNTLSSQADILIGGRMLGATAMGLYSMPRLICLRLSAGINGIVTRVGFPVMSKVQAERATLRRVYAKILRMTAFVNFPIYVSLALFAPEIVSVIFGAQWEDSIIVLRVLALWALFRSTSNPAGSLLFAVGRADLAFWWSVGVAAFTIPALFLGAFLGLEALAWSALVTAAAPVVPIWFVLIRPICGIEFRDYFAQLVIPLIVAIAAGAFAFASTALLAGDVARLAVGLPVGGIAYLALSYLINRESLGAVRDLVLPSRKIEATSATG